MVIWQKTKAFCLDAGFFCSGFLLILMLGVTACGGGGGGGSSAPGAVAVSDDMGELILGITDAEGDFLSYDITVQTITLTRQNGDVVTTLPLATRIDFTELTEVTELVTLATIPAGIYETVTVRLDFSDAQIMVEDATGNAVQAEARDVAGNLLDVVDMQLQLATADVIRIRPGIPAAFSLDFDLNASNTVDTSVMPAVVTVEPVLLATPELETDREHRVRGLMQAVDETDNAISLGVRPFRHRGGSFGELIVSVDDETLYEVDGVGYVGAQGLTAVAGLPANAPLQALGTVAAPAGDRMFSATTIVAGSSVPWQGDEVLRGVVSARSDQTLTVIGAHVEFGDGRRAYRGTFSVQLSDDTTVSAPGDGEHTTQRLSVGQRILAWGEYVDDQTLTASRVRMRLTGLSGEVVQVEPLVVDLYRLGGRDPDRFDFAGTGLDAQHDANPDHYEIDTGVLPLAALQAGDLVRGRGLVRPFAAAPADFTARTVIDVNTDGRSGVLAVGWAAPSGMPFSNIDPARIDVDLAAARVALKLRGIPRDHADQLTSVALLAPDSGSGVYAVRVRGENQLHLFRSFADLVDELVEQLDAGRLLHRIGAQGQYNISQQAMVARRVSFVFVANENG